MKGRQTMMIIANKQRYQQHREASDQGTHTMVHDLWLPILLFGSMGAITWAIRGTSGWGGVDGTVVPGLMWGLLWYYLCYRRGIEARGIVLWLGLGIALGGELGYGQYVGWMQGIFNVGNETIPIAPWIGYAWFVLCGIGWAAPGGIMLGWALGDRTSKAAWLVRSLLLLGLLVLLFAWPFVDWLSGQFVRIWPGLLFPHADLGLYAGELGKHLERTVYTNTQNFTVVLWWLIALLVAWLQRDRTTLVTGLLLGGGFGIGFMQSALWCLGYGIAPGHTDWWKMWELNAGFNLGLLYSITLFWAIRQVDKNYHRNGVPRTAPEENIVRTATDAWQETLFLAIGGSLLLFFMGFEYFFWTGIFLSVFYLVAMSLTLTGTGKTYDINAEKRRNILLTYSAFLLIFLMFHGGSSAAGVLLGFYSVEAVDQYAWPAARIALFVPVALLLVGVTLVKMWRIIRTVRTPQDQSQTIAALPQRMVDLMTGMAFIGALSIWPAKIGVLYAVFIFLALFAFNRINRRYNNDE
jgi:hypothetical protein